MTCTLVLIAPQAVSAHGYIVRSIPENRAVLERSPARVSYWFSEDLEPDFSSITIRDSAGTVIAEGGVAPESGALLTARLPAHLPDGAYVVDLRLAFASDGHVVAESRTFFIGEASGAVTGTGSNQTVIFAETLWRAVMLIATMLLFGTFTVYTLVLVPAWGSATYPAGRLPPRVINRLALIVLLGLIGAFAATIAALLQQTSVFFGADIGRVIGEGLWNVVRIGTRFGDTWNARMLLLGMIAALFGASLFFRRDNPGLLYPLWTACAWGMALVLGAWSVSAHAAGSLTLAWVALLSDWIHGMAAGFWAGGLAALTLVLPAALQPYAADTQGAARRSALLAALNRFSPIAAVGLIIVLTTGIYNTLNWLTRPADVTSRYSGSLAIKLLFVALLIGVGALHHMALDPARYERFLNLTRRIREFLPTLRLESGLVIVVLIAAGVLSATPPPDPDLAGETAAAPRVSADLAGYALSASITPGGAGVNTYDVVITQDGAPVDGLPLRVQFADPARDWRGGWHVLDNLGDGLYTAVGDDVNQTGAWWALIDVGANRAAFAIEIDPAAAVIQQRPPNVIQLAALLAVIAALAYAAYPAARRFTRTLDLSPAAVTVALITLVAGGVITVIGMAAAFTVQQSYDVTVSPPPGVVNTVLPDQASLDRGAALVAGTCAGWSGDLGALVNRLERTRDEDLYAITRDGWRDLAPCTDLNETERWDVVNYLRSLEI